MSTDKKSATKSSGWRRLLPLVAAVFAIGFLSTTLFNFIAYPTESHRLARDQYSKLVMMEPNAEMSQDDIDAKQDVLLKSEESQYSTPIEAIWVIVDIVGIVVLTYLVYRRIRRHRLAVKTVGATAAVMTVALTLEMIISWIIYYRYAESWSSLAWLWPISVVLYLILTFIIASLCESWYKRRNSFEI